MRQRLRKAAPVKQIRRPHQTLIQRSRAKSPSEKATYHQVTGAGRRQVLRKFFGLNASDEAVIEQRIADGLDKALKEA